jgi:hypothetical protein
MLFGHEANYWNEGDFIVGTAIVCGSCLLIISNPSKLAMKELPIWQQRFLSIYFPSSPP